jgi:hypothetical protein
MKTHIHKKHIKLVIIVFLSIFLIRNGYSQLNTGASLKKHLNYYKSGIKQIRENANFGLVFAGPEVIYGHYWEYSKNNRIFSIENEIGVCIPFSKGIPALDIYFKPAEISYLIPITWINNFAAGPLVKFEYNYTLYPQLQSAFDYWFTNFSLGIKTLYDFNIAGQSMSVRLKSSLCGFYSRQPDYRNPYFYDIGFKHAVKHLNSDLKFSTLSDYNSSDFELSWKQKADSRITLVYCLNYTGYFEKPEISIVRHSIKLMLNPKSK